MLNINKVRILINKNKWDDIYHFIKNKKIDLLKPIINKNNIIHIAAANNKNNIIKHILQHNSEYLEKGNDDGETPIHIMASYGYNDILKKCLKKNSNYINLLDNNGDTIVHIVNRETSGSTLYNMVLNVVDRKNINFNQMNSYGESVLTYNIDHTKKRNDGYYNKIKDIIKYTDINLSKNPILLKAIEGKKKHIINLLLDNGADVNVKNSAYMTPVLMAVYNKMYDTVKLLIEKGAYINYSGAEGDQNPLMLSMNRKDSHMVDILLDYKFDVKKYNRNMRTPLHIAFSGKSLQPSQITKLIYYGDMTTQDIEGKTPLHYLLKNHNWKNYDVILEQKKLDIFIKDKKSKAPVEYINNNELSHFINIVAKGYLAQLKQESFPRNISKRCNQNTVNKEHCLQIIKKHILKRSKSYPDETPLNIIEGPDTNIGRFNSDTLHSILYTIYILKKHKSLCVPFQYYIHDKVMTDLMKTNSIIRSGKGMILKELINIYMNNLYEILPSVIIWKDADLYYINKDVHLHLDKCLYADGIRFIFFKITMIVSEEGTHANILIIDKEEGTIERFDPYGDVPYLDGDKLDDVIQEKIGRYVNTYLKEYGKELKYLRPKDYMKIGFQTISNDGDIRNKKLSDPVGYCLAWIFYYIEMRVSNPKLHPKQLVQKIIKTIQKRGNGDTIFIDFIRNYATKLDHKKNQILKSSGIKEDKLYNLVRNKKDLAKITDTLASMFSRIIKERI